MECKPQSGEQGCGASLGHIQSGRPEKCPHCHVPQALETTKKVLQARAAANVEKLAAKPSPRPSELVAQLQARQPMVCCHL
jgi:hypothetical protein